jgi:hypothetical protein
MSYFVVILCNTVIWKLKLCSEYDACRNAQWHTFHIQTYLLVWLVIFTIDATTKLIRQPTVIVLAPNDVSMLLSS